MNFEDLLGGPSEEAPAPPQPAKRRPGRPTKEEAARRAAEQAAQERSEDEERAAYYASPAGQQAIRAAANGTFSRDRRAFFMPVTQNFLAEVWGFGDPMTVSKRLRKVKPVGYSGGTSKRPLFDFKEASEHLLTPKMDLATYLKTLNPADMPLGVNKVFWEAERIKNKALLETGEAWPTENVLDVLGGIFMLIKDRMPFIYDRMRDLGLNDEQQEKLQVMLDTFQTDLHANLVEMPKKGKSYSRLAEIDTGERERTWEDDE